MKVQTYEGPSALDGLWFAALVVAVAAAERLDRARATVVDYDLDPGWLSWVWPLIALAGAVVASLSAASLVHHSHQLSVGRGLTAGSALRQKLLPRLLATAIGLWTVWQLTGAGIVHGWDFPNWPRTLLHVGAIVAACAAVGWAGGVVPGDATRAWKDASVVRLQLLVLGALLAIVLFAPVTADQCLDVLRAWGDGPYTRAAIGIAGAVLLGSVCRASARLLLLPETSRGRRWVRDGGDRLATSVRRVVQLPPHKPRVVAVLPWAAPPLVVAGALGYLGLVPAAVALMLVTAMMVLTKFAPPKAADDRESMGRLAGTLGIVPLTILLAGLASAATDSILLPSGLTRTDLVLLIWTGVVFGLLWWLVATVQDPEPEAATLGKARELSKRDRFTLGGLAVAGFFGALAPGAVLGLSEIADVVAASLLLVVAIAIASRRILPAGGSELWVGGAVVLGAAVALYAEPVAAARVLGSFGLIFVGTVGILLLAHVAGAVGARRAFRADWLWLPERAPIVALLAVWIAVAFGTASPRTHQARTGTTAAVPSSVHDAVHAWLDQQAKSPVTTASGKAYIPMFLIAASGGGSKAAYWTDLVADCLFGRGAPDATGECAKEDDTASRYGRLFLTSSVSGGSVGVRHLVTHAAELAQGRPWVDASAGLEALSPVVGWGLFHDLPAFMLGLDTDPRKCLPGRGRACRVHADRALVQETAIAGGEDGMLEGPRDPGLLGSDGPATVFNAAEDGAARRILLSPLELAPSPRRADCLPRTGEPVNTAIDAHDVLGSENGRQFDLPLVTAALVSARFPLVAPPARLSNDARRTGSGCTPSHLDPVIARDGGYIENSGVLTIAELLPALQAEIVQWKRGQDAAPEVWPVVISIDDDPLKPTELRFEDSPSGTFGIGKKAGSGLLTSGARAAIENCAVHGVSYFRISPPPRKGAKAATGWEISETVRAEDLGDALMRPPARDQVVELRGILAGTATSSPCKVGP